MRGRVALGASVAFGIALAIGCGGGSGAPSGAPADAGADGALPSAGDGAAIPPFAVDGGCSCSDPACGCVAVPDGWLAVAAISERDATGSDVTDGGAAAACPAYWTDPRALRASPAPANGACSCACGAMIGNPCLTGGRTLTVRLNLPGETTCAGDQVALSNVATCTRLPAGGGIVTNDTDGRGPATLSPIQVDCAVTATKAPIVDDGQVSVCTSPAPLPCVDGMCVARPSPGAPVCLLHEGSVACPWQVPARRVLTPESGITDDRQCSCRCRTNTTACDSAVIRFYTNATCTGSSRALTSDGTCRGISGTGAATYYRVTSRVDDGTRCLPLDAAPLATGTVTTTEQTLCCPAP